MGTTGKRRKFPPIYEQPVEEARERNELEQYFASQKLNTDCGRAITAALSKHYSGSTFCLNTDAAAKEVVDKFGFDRTMYVLASTIRYYDHDGRISYANKKWAQEIPFYGDRDIAFINSNPGLTDMFANQVRHDYLLTQPLKAQEVKAEAERILSQLQDLHEPNSPNGEQFMVRVSPRFLERAKPKNMERLMSLLPFPSLNISQAEGQTDTYATIDRGEDRSQPLQLRKPSVKERLTVKPIAGDKPAVQSKDRGAR